MNSGRDQQKDAPELTRRGFVVGACAGVSTGTAGAAAAANGNERDAANKDAASPNPRLFSFVGGSVGEWVVTSTKALVGDSWPAADRVAVVTGPAAAAPGQVWVLSGVTSNTRYTTREEKSALVSKQAPLGRPTARRAALIPIRKNAQWWELTQEERRKIFEEKSKHTTVGLQYLPAIARRLHHCRDLSNVEPFDFLTWFDFAEADEPAFDHMLTIMRASEEWKYVDREVDIRLRRSED